MNPFPGIINPPSPMHLVLSDHTGELFRFADALAHGPMVVVFFRGHWCPYCRRYLCKLAGHFPRIRERGAGLVAISPEPPDTSAALAAQLGLPFPILADTEGRVIDLFGVRNRFGASHVLLPHAAVFIFDSAGQLRFRSVDRNYKKRTTVRSMLAALDALPQSSVR